jgi:hypothetical protein
MGGEYRQARDHGGQQQGHVPSSGTRLQPRIASNWIGQTHEADQPGGHKASSGHVIRGGFHKDAVQDALVSQTTIGEKA